MKVLVIEDTVTSATLVCHQLTKMGLLTVHARDGESGVEMFKRDRPDLVLLDIIMPGMDGFEVAHRIRQLEQDGDWTPIIFLSARASDEDLARGIAAGGEGLRGVIRGGGGGVVDHVGTLVLERTT